MLKRALVSFALVGFMLLPFVARAPSAWADTPSDAGVGSGEGSHVGSAGEPATALPTTKPSDTVVNPVTQPVQAWSDEKAARKVGWPLAIWLGLVMLGKGLAYSRDKFKTTPVIGKLAAWLAKGKGAMILAAIGGCGAAGYDTVVNGGSWVAALVAAGAALGGVMHSTTKDADKTTGGGASNPSPS